MTRVKLRHGGGYDPKLGREHPSNRDVTLADAFGRALRAVVRRIGDKRIALDELDSEITACTLKIETWLADLRIEQLHRTRIDAAHELAWSARGASWRLVVRTERNAVEIHHAARELRALAYSSGAMTRLIELVKASRRAPRRATGARP